MLKRAICAALSALIMLGAAGITAYADNTEDIEDAVTIDDAAADEDFDNSDNDTDADYSDDNDGNDDIEAPEEKDGEAVAGGGNETPQVTVPARNIRLRISMYNEMVIGDNMQIEYSLSPLKSDDYVTYKNHSKNIVKVDENGLVTAVGYGKARVQLISSSGRKKNVYFIVTDAEGNDDAELETGEVEEIEFADKYIMLRAGKTYQSEAIFYPLGLYADLTYSSSNDSIATVTSGGKIKGLKAGSAVITASAENGVTAEMNVTVYDDILRGIDVSKWQGDINWKTVSVSGIDFVMIRSSFGSEHVDEYLDKNVKGCEKYDIPYGFYHYTYARTPSEAKTEAKFFLENIKDYSPEYPVVLDIEESFYKEMSKKDVTKVTTSFMDVIEDAGYYAMVYNSPNFIKACIDTKALSKYDIWIACWGDEDRLNSLYDGHYGIWQYSATGKVSGINGDVDLDYSYKDYEKIIRKNGLNNLQD